jgi:hypothetical protein
MGASRVKIGAMTVDGAAALKERMKHEAIVVSSNILIAANARKPALQARDQTDRIFSGELRAMLDAALDATAQLAGLIGPRSYDTEYGIIFRSGSHAPFNTATMESYPSLAAILDESAKPVKGDETNDCIVLHSVSLDLAGFGTASYKLQHVLRKTSVVLLKDIFCVERRDTAGRGFDEGEYSGIRELGKPEDR